MIGIEPIIERGLPVFPCRENDKRPITAHGCKDATTDVRQIQEWHRQYPACNWGAATGNGIVVVDVDNKSGHHGDASLATLGDLPHTLTNVTPNNGRHLLFRVDGEVRNSAGALGDGLDVRGDGGYIVIPPSKLAVGTYHWQDDRTDIARAPDVLLEKIAAAKSQKTAKQVQIPQGQRNDTLFRYACMLRMRNVGDAEAWETVRARNLDCVPPLDEAELRKIFEGAWKYPAGFAKTDLGNRDRLVAKHGDDLRFLIGGGWHIWQGHRFTPDRERRVIVLMGDVARGIYVEASNGAEKKEREELSQWAKVSESRGRIESALTLAEAHPEVVELVENFDADPLLVGMRNGVYDLRNDEFREGRRDDRITLAVDVDFDPTATCPRWEQFQREVHEGDAEVVAFKQRAWGYTLSGDVSEQKLFIAWGSGANGKTTEQNVAFRLLGDYARKVEPDTLLQRDRQGINNDIARLRGARFIGTEETGDGKQLAEGLVKQLTGNNRIAARFLYREHFEFTLAGKIWIATNHRPEVAGTDYAIWRRILLVPYPVRFDESQRDSALESKLLAERAGIFNWMLEGFRQWRATGLKAPAAVVAATEQYRADMDRVGAFLADCCIERPEARTKASTVYAQYKTWVTDNGGRPLAARKFHERMERDHGQYRVKNVVDWYIGLGLTSKEGGHDQM